MLRLRVKGGKVAGRHAARSYPAGGGGSLGLDPGLLEGAVTQRFVASPSVAFGATSP